MSLKIIGAGFGRTGTLSLKHALEHIGFGPCHHMEEVFEKPAQLTFWQAAAGGNPIDWDRVFDGYGSCVDWPSARYWRELADHFSDAKVILSMRDVDRWWESYAGTIRRVFKAYQESQNAHHRSVGAMAYRTIVDQTFGGDDSPENAKRAFLSHAETVRQTIPADRLLVFEVSAGWGPLCDFLGVPVPDRPFPRSNDRSAFWRGSDNGEPDTANRDSA